MVSEALYTMTSAILFQIMQIVEGTLSYYVDERVLKWP